MAELPLVALGENDPPIFREAWAAVYLGDGPYAPPAPTAAKRKPRPRPLQ